MSGTENLSVIREAFGKVVYTHKTHEKERELLSARATRSAWLSVLLTALTTSGVVAASLLSTPGFLWTSVSISALATANALYQLSFRPAEEAARHRAAAKSLLVIRDRYMTLIADITSGLPAAEATQRRDQLAADASAIYNSAPDTSPKSYAAAQKALKDDSESTFDDAEIDEFLPAPLRLTPPNATAPSARP